MGESSEFTCATIPLKPFVPRELTSDRASQGVAHVVRDGRKWRGSARGAQLGGYDASGKWLCFSDAPVAASFGLGLRGLDAGLLAAGSPHYAQVRKDGPVNFGA